MPLEIEQDVAAIGRIEAVPTILRTICASTGLRCALISRVRADRWIACALHDELGLPLTVGGELDVDTTLCSKVRDSHQPIVLDHISVDPVYGDNPMPKLYGFESYIAVPIFRQNREYFGNLCGLDTLPRHLKDDKTLATMQLFSKLVSLQLDAEERYEGGRVELIDQREAAKLREEFIAVLGHDMRIPLSSIMAGTDFLLRKTGEGADRHLLRRIHESSRRIAALVDDLLDLARGRLGGGIALELASVDDLVERLRQVVAEVQGAHPDRPIAVALDCEGPVRCDQRRFEQLLSNLLANAIEHGAKQTPIAVSLMGDDEALELRVVNDGTIPDDERGRLFQPYFRGAQSGRGGLGLGLYIVSEIAKSHGGSIRVDSSAGRTTFTFRMPRGEG